MQINAMIFRLLQSSLLAVPRTLKEQSSGVLRIWAHQCECVFAQRLRRGQQMFSLYTKLWEERALKDLLSKMRKHFTKRSKEMMLGAVGLSMYNWDINRISTRDMNKYINELEYIQLLAQNTITCERCKRPGKIIICKCNNSIKKAYDNWMPFVEREDMVVWRKEHSDSGHYEYKVYGSFNDVSGEDFLNVQIDTEYRKKWDNTAISLEVVETDPNPTSNSDIVYWEMLWPKLFVNRDYVFNRRFMVDDKKKTIVLMSRGTKHPSCPVKADKYRVDTYWSYMVIRPYTELDKPGIEFGLTYFDDPGVNIPSTVTTWVAMRAMPDYLTRLRLATREYRAYCANDSNKYMCKLADYKKKMETNLNDETPRNISLEKHRSKPQSPILTSIENLIKSRISQRQGICLIDEETLTNKSKSLTDSSTKNSLNAPIDIMTSPSTLPQTDINYYFT
ncbi:hypothetical protein RN001_004748 [Aquatica leii]|uniref:Phosphatidylcholine transfer protein n=1 Tax=Aquatica leii TaxID=1421715 RepID=A0AAN7SI58_9COLE|nr:hypothetical protein RN001_004748 [Aquatica leii]